MAAIVAEALRADGIDAILTGGSVVSIYTANEFESWDLDFIVPGMAKAVGKTMLRLGFKKADGRHFRHPDSPFHVEFPGSVPTVGREVLHRFAERQTKYGTVRLLTPTDSVKDRLAAYVHWNDRQSLEQAVAITKRQSVNMKDVERWAAEENGLEKYREFVTRLRAED
ncbi:MAG: hypothetical protein ACRETN_03210 [Nevskiales bacterium]